MREFLFLLYIALQCDLLFFPKEIMCCFEGEGEGVSVVKK